MCENPCSKDHLDGLRIRNYSHVQIVHICDMSTKHTIPVTLHKQQDLCPRLGDAAFAPVADDVGFKLKSAGKLTDPVGGGDGLFENVHGADSITNVITMGTKVTPQYLIMKTLAERLIYARKAKGWSRAHLSVTAEVSKSTVAMTELGKRDSKGSVPAFAKALGVRYEWLQDGVGDMYEPQTTPLAEMTDSVARQVKQLEIVLRSVPDAARKDAFLAASQALVGFLPGAK